MRCVPGTAFAWPKHTSSGIHESLLCLLVGKAAGLADKWIKQFQQSILKRHKSTNKQAINQTNKQRRFHSVSSPAVPRFLFQVVSFAHDEAPPQVSILVHVQLHFLIFLGCFDGHVDSLRMNPY